MDITDEGWRQGIDIYFLSAVRPTRLVTPIMDAQGSGGSIINITTFATFEPDPAFPTSGVGRAGLAVFAKLFADKYAAEGIRINNVLPGVINSLAEKEEFRQRIPMGGMVGSRRLPAPSAFWHQRLRAISPGRICGWMAASRGRSNRRAACPRFWFL